MTHQHLLVLANPDPLSFHDLEVLQTTQHLVLDLEADLHAELGSLLDDEGLCFERFDASGGTEVDDDFRSACDFKAERCNDTFTLIGGVDWDKSAGGKTERSFPSVQGLVVLVCRAVREAFECGECGGRNGAIAFLLWVGVCMVTE